MTKPLKCPSCGAIDLHRTGDSKSGVVYIFCNICGKQIPGGGSDLQPRPLCEVCRQPMKFTGYGHIGGYGNPQPVYLCPKCDVDAVNHATERLVELQKLTWELQKREDIVSIVEEAVSCFASDACPKCGYVKDAADYIEPSQIHQWLKERMK